MGTKEEEGTLVTGEGSNESAGSTKPTEVWTLRPNWSTVGSTFQEEETTIKVLTTIDDATEVTSFPTEQVTAIVESVTTEAAGNITQAVTETVKAEDIVTPAVTETVPLIDATSLLIESVSVTEESSTESTRADLTTTTSAPTPADATTTAFDPLPSCQAPGFRCKDGLTCVGPAQVCDGISDCPQHEEGEGGEDEEGCASSGGGEVASTVASVTADEDG